MTTDIGNKGRSWPTGSRAAVLEAAGGDLLMSRRHLLKIGAAGAAMAPLASLFASGEAFGQAATDKELRVAVEDFVDEQMDATKTTTELDEILCAIYEPPFQIDDSGKVAPGIVKAWEISPEGDVWTLHLRDDVVFHDGSKMTAADVAYSYGRSCQDSSVEHDTWVEMLGNEPQIDIVDDTTLKVHTKGPQPLFAGLSTEYGASVWIVPKAYIDKVGEDGFRDHPIATGPYEFVEHVAADHFSMKAVDYKHWRVNPQFAKVTVLLVPEEATRVALLRTGDIDETLVSRENAVALQKDGYTIWQGVSQLTYVMVIGAYHELAKGMPLANVKVRHALSLAVNRQEVVETLFGNNAAVPSGPVRVGLHMPDVGEDVRTKWGAWAKDAYKFDLAAAKAMMADAGYANGFTFDLWVAPDTGAPYQTDLAQILVSYWAQLGVTAVVTNIDSGVWNADRNSRKSTAAIGKMGFLTSSLDKVSAVENLNPFTSTGGTVDSIYGSPQQPAFDALWKDGMTTLDEAQRQKDLDQMIQIATDSWTEISLVETPSLFAFGPRVNPVLPRKTVNFGYFYADWKPTGK